MDLVRSYQKRKMKLRAMLFDPSTLELSEERLGKLTQRDRHIPLMQDRLREVASFYGITEAECEAILADKNMEAYKRLFDDTSTDQKVFDAYREARKVSNMRHMTAYTRFPGAAALLKYLNSIYLPFRRRHTHMLDYGCGISDYGLAFATQGYQVTLCDIGGGNMELGKWRFQTRNIPVNVIELNEVDPYPDLGKQHIIVAGEVLEHVREPLLLLDNFYKALPVGGFLWYSGFPNDERSVGGSHLPEAAEQRLEAVAYVEKNFRSATRIQLPGYLYQKV